MSTILKALRRLEEDKRARTSLSLEEAVLEPAVSRRARNLWVGIGAGFAAALGVMAIAWSLSSLWLPDAAARIAASDASRPPDGVADPASAPQPKPASLADAPHPPPTTPIPIRPTTAQSRLEVIANAGDARREMQRLAGAPTESPGASGAGASPGGQAAAARPGATAKSERMAARLARARSAMRSKPAPAPAPRAPAPEAALASAGSRPPSEPPAVSAPSPMKTAATAASAPAASPTPKPTSSTPPHTASSVSPKSVPVPKPRPAVASDAESSAALPIAKAAEPAVQKQVAQVVDREAEDFTVQQITWHPVASRRVAVVRLEGESAPIRVTEGEVIDGFEVKKIGLSEIELTRDGVTVERRLGEGGK